MREQQPIKLQSGGLMPSDYLIYARDSFLKQSQEADFIAACGQPLRKSIRVNTLKINVEQFKAIARSYRWKLTAIPWCPEGFWVESENDSNEALLGNSAEHIQGLFYIQEASSMLPPVALLAAKSVSSALVVDMAAAPGSKTTQLAAMLNNQGIVLANELSASRLKGLHANLVRCGITNTCMSHQDGRNIGKFMPNQFDFVLLDAPCGGEGTVRKDINALKDWSLDKVKEIAMLQKELILSAYVALKPGGRLVYSTCTLSPPENNQVAEYLLQHSDAQLEPLDQLFEGAEKAATEEGYLLLLPHIFDSEGFFICSFSKPESTVELNPLKPIYSSPFVAINSKIKQQIVNYYSTHFSLDIQRPGYQLKQRDKEVWLFPQAIDSLDQYIKVNRGGLKVAQVFPNKIRSSHEFACCFGALAKRQILEINNQQFEQFLRGLNIKIDDSLVDNGEVLLSYNQQIIGIGQNQKGQIKNGLPRDLVKDNFRLA